MQAMQIINRMREKMTTQLSINQITTAQMMKFANLLYWFETI